MPLSIKRFLALGLFCFSGLLNAGETHPLASPTLSADTDIATAGFFRLSWSVPEGQEAEQEQGYELQESVSADFENPRVIYTGPDAATTFSGRADGEFYFRVRSIEPGQPSPWSTVAQVQVRHHPLARVWVFFALGAIVFLATLTLILRGATEEQPT